MNFKLTGVVFCAFLASCSGDNPFDAPTGGGDGETDTPTTGGIERDGVPPGTESPSAGAGLFRTESRDGSLGNGYAQSISYDGASDTFTVDNLAFDGANTYQRGSPVSSLNSGEFAVYEADSQIPDAVTGEPVNQFTHRAIYGVSRNLDTDGNPATQFAIVRTGAYVPYGFGGFIYQRGGAVELPSEGQAVFKGKTGGLRDFDNAGGLQYSTGDITIAIDFDDFNDQTGLRGDGVQGQLTNRQVFDINGNDITQNVIDGINLNAGNVDENAAFATNRIPAAIFTVGPGVLDDNGDLVGLLSSSLATAEGAIQYETGNYYAIVSGNDPDEIVGVLVLENTLDYEGTTARDTSGFIVYRDPDLQP